jgi:hypothetical protein
VFIEKLFNLPGDGNIEFPDIGKNKIEIRKQGRFFPDFAA